MKWENPQFIKTLYIFRRKRGLRKEGSVGGGWGGWGIRGGGLALCLSNPSLYPPRSRKSGSVGFKVVRKLTYIHKLVRSCEPFVDTFAFFFLPTCVAETRRKIATVAMKRYTSDNNGNVLCEVLTFDRRDEGVYFLFFCFFPR